MTRVSTAAESPDGPESPDIEDTPDGPATAEDPNGPGTAEGPDGRSAHPSPRQAIAVGTAAAVIAVLFAVTAAMVWQHGRAVEQDRLGAEFTAAARQGVVNLMSIDYKTAQETVQRVLDGSTGQFRENFAGTAEDFVDALQQEKVTTRAMVNDAAVESITGDSAVVLVSATSVREGPQAPQDQRQPRVWRVVVSLQREGEDIKISGVEFV